MPKVLFITADQWRADCLGAAGHPCLRTPNLDRLARDGMRFTRHYAQAAPCGPSRASLLTGMYLMNHRVVDNGTPLDPRFTNLALEMRRLGYESSIIGYTDTTADPRGRSPRDPALRTYCGLAPGFRQLVPDSEGPIAWMRHLRRHGYDHPNVDHPELEPTVWRPVTDHPGASERGPTFGPAPYPAELSDTAFSVDHAIDHLRDNAGQDWFLHLSLLRPHPPFIVPAPYNALYAPEDGPAFARHASAEEEAAVHPFAAWRCRGARAFARQQGLDIDDERYRRQLRATYWGMVTEVDTQLGRLFEVLAETGDDADTLVVFTTDHGEQLLDHWQLGKRSFNEQSFHIPLIIRAPDMPAARRGAAVDAFTENVDIMPTVLDWLGAPVPAQCDGRALTPWLRGETPNAWRDAAMYELDFRDLAGNLTQDEFGLHTEACSFAVLRGERYKYIHFAGLAPLMFDIDEDRDELHDLASQPAHAALAGEQAQRLLSRRMTHLERTHSLTRINRTGLVSRA